VLRNLQTERKTEKAACSVKCPCPVECFLPYGKFSLFLFHGVASLFHRGCFYLSGEMLPALWKALSFLIPWGYFLISLDISLSLANQACPALFYCGDKRKYNLD